MTYTPEVLLNAIRSWHTMCTQHLNHPWHWFVREKGVQHNVLHRVSQPVQHVRQRIEPKHNIRALISCGTCCTHSTMRPQCVWSDPCAVSDWRKCRRREEALSLAVRSVRHLIGPSTFCLSPISCRTCEERSSSYCYYRFHMAETSEQWRKRLEHESLHWSMASIDVYGFVFGEP